MPAQYVKPYVKRGKNDAADAEAICEAVGRPTMRFVPVKTPEQQSVMMLHLVRLMLNRQRTQLSNSIRAHLSEFGIVAPSGGAGSISFSPSLKMRKIGVCRPKYAFACKCWRRSLPW
jgi:transposase